MRLGWLRLFASLSSYVLCVAAVVTVVIKILIARDLDAAGTSPPIFAVWVGALDVAIYFGFAALFAMGEARFFWLKLFTWPLALGIGALAVVNACYMYVTGEQLSWGTLKLGTARFADFWSIAVEHLRAFGWPLVALVGTAVVGLPIVLARLLDRRGADAHRDGRARAAWAGGLAAAAAILHFVLPHSDEPAVKNLGANATIATYLSWLEAPDEAVAAFAGYPEPRLVSDAQITRLRQTRGPNIILVVLESTRFDHTSLAGDAARARTPNLLLLAERGTSFVAARAVVPHTTKSLFTLLCGRYPVMQQPVIEAGGVYPTQCLAEVLKAAGYATAFFQSAVGRFEMRDLYVRHLGYETFASWEQLHGEPLGYLASADDSLRAPVTELLAKAGDKPFFLTVLTSATHHPYRLPKTLEAPGTPMQRYARLVEAEDALLGAIWKALDDHQLTGSTIVVALGDHGEGFGDRGVRQHDNNYFEEGLHVPFVIAGPGVPRSRVTQNVSLLDLTPTLLGRLGAAALPAVAGIDLLAAPVPPARPLLFNCWQEERCHGFVLGTQKVVRVPQTGEAFRFDLAADPTEARALEVPPDLLDVLGSVEQVIFAHQASYRDLIGW